MSFSSFWDDITTGKERGDFEEAFDWLKNLYENFSAADQGSYSITIGNELDATILGNQESHVYGGQFNMVVDWSALIGGVLGRWAQRGPVTGELGGGGMAVGAAFGLTGCAYYSYGSYHNLLYGESIDIKRAVQATASGKNHLWDWFEGKTPVFAPSELQLKNPGANGPTPTQQSVDNIVSVICAILSALMILVPLVLELIVYLKYPTPDPNAGLAELQAEFAKLGGTPPKPGTNVYNELANSFTIPPGPAAMETTLEKIAVDLPTRLAAVIEQIELIGQVTRDANKDLWITEKYVAATKSMEKMWASVESGANYLAAGASQSAANGAQNAKTLAKDAADKFEFAVVLIKAIIQELTGTGGA